MNHAPWDVPIFSIVPTSTWTRFSCTGVVTARQTSRQKKTLRCGREVSYLYPCYKTYPLKVMWPQRSCDKNSSLPWTNSIKVRVLLLIHSIIFNLLVTKWWDLPDEFMSLDFLLSARNSPWRKHQRLLFTYGITKVCYKTLIDLFITDIRVCHPEMWKAVACTLHIKPCQTKTHTTTICKWVFWNLSSRGLVVLFCMTKGIRNGPRSISRCRDFSLSLSIRMIWLHEFPLIWNTRNVLNGLTILSTKACLWHLWNLRFLKNFCPTLYPKYAQ